jgi:threonyl-tRNA synthetase
MLHRAILGSLERFIGILIENYAGKFPLWLSPVQVVVTTITNEFDDYARKIYELLRSSKIRAKIDLDSQKISYKIREHSLMKVPYIIAIGKKEFETNSISVRKLGEDSQINLSPEDFLRKIQQEINSKILA